MNLLMSRRLICIHIRLVALAFTLLYCINVSVVQAAAAPTDPPAVPPSAVASLNQHFAAASAAFNVPVSLLKAVSYVETRWQMVRGRIEFEGVAPAFGVMALRGEKLLLAAHLARVSPNAVRTEASANIFAGAALLRHYARQASLGCGDLSDWKPVLTHYNGVTEPRWQRYYVSEIKRVLEDGASVTTHDGNLVASIRQAAVIGCK